MIATDTQLITEIVNLYFNGTYYGNADQLKRAFHSEAHITGSLNGQIYDWTLIDFIARVTTIPTSEDKGEKYDKEIIFMDITNNAAWGVKFPVIFLTGNIILLLKNMDLMLYVKPFSKKSDYLTLILTVHKIINVVIHYLVLWHVEDSLIG